MQPEIFRKLCIMGGCSVGKSTMAKQFAEESFSSVYQPTIENTYTKQVELGGKTFLVELVDTAGHDMYSPLNDTYAADVHGYILTYSIDSSKSFEIVKSLHEKMKDMCLRVPLILVGNKSDLHKQRQVSYKAGKDLAKSWGAKFLELSALERYQVSKAFDELLISIEEKEGHFVNNRSPKKLCVVQ